MTIAVREAVGLVWLRVDEVGGDVVLSAQAVENVGERLFGVARDSVLVYTPDGARGAAFPALAPGFHGIRPLLCADSHPVLSFDVLEPWTCTIEGVVDPRRPFHPYPCHHGG